MEEITVELFNGFTKRTMGLGCIKPKMSLIITSNEPFSESERYSLQVSYNVTIYSYVFGTGMHKG